MTENTRAAQLGLGLDDAADRTRARGLPEPDRAAQALAYAEQAARWRAVMGDAAGTAEGVRRLVEAGALDARCGATIAAVLGR